MEILIAMSLLAIIGSQVMIAIEVRKVSQAVENTASMVDGMREMLLRVLPAAGTKQ